MRNILTFATTVIGIASALLKAGMDAAAVLESGGNVIRTAQKEGRDPNDAEWDAIHKYRHALEAAAKG